MNGSSLRVTVHGRKYHITGIEKETSCKDLLCALAKATKLNPTRCPPTIAEVAEPNERSVQGVYGLKRPPNSSYSRAQLSENILNKLKGDCSRAGDADTLRILNSLGNRVKIFARDSVDVAVADVGGAECAQGYKKRKKKPLSPKEESIRQQSRGNWQVRDRAVRKKEKNSYKVEPPIDLSAGKRHHGSRRSVDDSDIDSYKPDSLARIKNRRSKACDDSDLDLYENLFHMVLEQTQQLNTIRKQQRDVRKSSWVRQLKRSSQIYIIDDQRAPQECLSTDKPAGDNDGDDDDDSGLPSADYDSSASQDVTPKDENGNKIANLIPSSPSKSHPAEGKVARKRKTKSFSKSFAQNSVIVEIDRIDELTKSSNASSFSKQGSAGSSGLRVNCSKLEPNCLTSEQPRERRIVLEGSSKGDRVGKRLSVCSFSSTTSTLRNEVLKNINDVEVVVEAVSSTCESEKINVMVSDDAVFNRSNSKNNGHFRRLSGRKKKLKKSDISDPVLIDPATFKKHSNLKDISAIAETVISEASSKWKHRASFRGSSRRKKKDLQPEFTPVDKLPPPPTESTRLQVTETVDCSPPLGAFPSDLATVDEDRQPNLDSKEVGTLSSKVRERLLSERASSRRGRFSSDQRTVHKVKESSDPVARPLEDPACAPVVALADSSSPQTLANDLVSSLAVFQNGPIAASSPVDSSDLPVLKLDRDEDPVPEPDWARTVTELLSSLISDDTDASELNVSLEANTPRCCQPQISVLKFPVLSDKSSDSIGRQTCLQVSPNCSYSICNGLNEESGAADSPCTENETFAFPEADVSHVQLRNKMVGEYLSVMNEIDFLIPQITYANDAVVSLANELHVLEKSAETENLHLKAEEEKVLKELDSVKSLLRSVTDLTQYQRKEVAQNIAAMDELEFEIRGKRAAFENDICGLWMETAKHAPRTLLKRRQEIRLPSKFDHISLV